MQNKALVVIDLQNDITKNYKDIIDNVNAAVDGRLTMTYTSPTFAMNT